MRKKAVIFLVLFLVMLLTVSVFVMAAQNRHEPVRTQTQYCAGPNCDQCEGEPLKREFRSQVERELFMGENGGARRLHRQRFGQ